MSLCAVRIARITSSNFQVQRPRIAVLGVLDQKNNQERDVIVVPVLMTSCQVSSGNAAR
jgi:hypothetical protein